MAPAHYVHRDAHIAAFLDIHPIREGYVQIVPRRHYACFDELPPEIAAEIVHFGQRIGAALKRVYGVRRAAFLFTGTDIAHAHAHVLPLHAPTDITSRRYIVEENLTFRSTPRVPDAALSETAATLRDALGGAADESL